MRKYRFVLANVFAESHFGGNPLAIFPEATGLSDIEMQRVAHQFNLSETVFAFPSGNTAADLRIFTPATELPFAGHPVLGCTFVLQQEKSLSENFKLNTGTKPVPLNSANNTITLQLKGYKAKRSKAIHAVLAAASSISGTQITPIAYWLDSDSPQLLLQVNNHQALQNAKPDYSSLHSLCTNDGEKTVLYLWHEQGHTVHACMFYAPNDTLLEDSNTGSTCANLVAYMIEQNHFPMTLDIRQGEQTGRLNHLHLRVDEAKQIYVGGQVIEVGKDVFKLPRNKKPV